MILGVKIQNRETKEFMRKGCGWSKIGKVWSTLRDAKLAICPHYYAGGISEKELNSDFLIINDDGTIEKTPVAVYFMDYFKRKLKHGYNKENILNIIGQIRRYCNENNIVLEECK